MDAYAYLGQRHSSSNRISFPNKLLKRIELFLYTYYIQPSSLYKKKRVLYSKFGAILTELSPEIGTTGPSCLGPTFLWAELSGPSCR